MKLLSVFTLSVSAIFLISCGNKKTENPNLKGKWHAELDLGGDLLPFEIGFIQNGEKWTMEAYHAEEILTFDEVAVTGDSIKVTMGTFDAEIRAKIIGNNLIEGVFTKNYAKDYFVPFKAEKGEITRFEVTEKPSTDFSGKWKTEFLEEDGDTYPAVGIFTQNGDNITGTFLTKLGDYRYLEGNVSGNTFFLSTFDGNHLFLFSGELQANGSVKGRFRSGPKSKETFTANRDEDYELPDAFSLNYLKEGYDTFSFTFPDVNGNPVSNQDEKFKDKVVLVQIFGTWCPNCVDETKFLGPWYEKNKDRGIEIIGLAFESKPEFDYASTRVKKTIDRLNANYTFLIAGVSDKEKASEALPALNEVLAFPTLIYMDKKGKVRKIHTGFTGPGTGDYYDRWVAEHEALVKELVEE
ncbi:peroxiredoxin family protein [Aquiflexum gelatinilyticum]|uniref:peroxiredoxin family protein n=1 Tax=Aquiflexum gelatinilyticum TaxID=2961943 RepID=UPI00216A3322|nr:TlpA disulfide reductase family protein [Aquiflexum gelatinilyticum]MCS4434067.1 TlpA family protein disulfide reductase [Aquiflexum gelatinilyticum]